MKKNENFETKLKAIRKKLQKETENLSDKEATEKTNKKAMEIAKEYGFQFQVDKSDYDIPVQQPLFINEEIVKDNEQKN